MTRINDLHFIAMIISVGGLAKWVLTKSKLTEAVQDLYQMGQPNEPIIGKLTKAATCFLIQEVCQ